MYLYDKYIAEQRRGVVEIIISSNTSKPIYEQITSQIKAMIMSGELKTGDPIPSMRALAKSIHVSVITVQKAYKDLQRDGFIETTVGRGLTCTLDRQHDTGNKAFVTEDLDRLFYGWLPKQTFAGTEGTYTYTVPLVKNTNNVRVVLQHLSGEAVDKDKFVFTITDTNGSMDWDNTLLPDELVTFYAWHTDAGEVGMDTRSEAVRSTSRAAFSAAIAELTVPRLVKGQETRLTVSNKETGKTVFSIPLIDYALLVKGFYHRNMDDQEYLDRQDMHDMVFFLDEDDHWLDTYIYINSWKVVLQNSEL